MPESGGAARKQVSSPHAARKIDLSAGVLDPEHFAGPFGGPFLLFCLILDQTRHRSVRWRRGEWHTIESLAADAARSVSTVRRWLAEIEAAGYVEVQRGKLGLKITLSKRVWFRGGRAMMTRAIPTTSGRDGIELSLPLPVSIPTTSGRDGGSIPTTSGRDTPTEAAPDAAEMIPSHRTSPYEQASPPALEKSGVKSVAERREFWTARLQESIEANDPRGVAWAQKNLAGIERG